jgi:cephalosporin hydroxylase
LTPDQTPRPNSGLTASDSTTSTAKQTEGTSTIHIDFDECFVEVVDRAALVRRHAFFTPEAFAAVSKAWLRVGFDNKYVYGFTWLGRPILQLPEDLIRVQEVIYRVRPDVIIETGIAHGGSLIFYASLCKAMGHGRVIGVDVEIRPHNRAAIEAHELFEYVDLVEGSSVAPESVEQVRSLINPGEGGFVMLDSNHSRAHVLAELEAYSQFVAVDSYVVAADGGIMTSVAGAPLAGTDWSWNNSREAAADFAQRNEDFVLDPPAPIFNEGFITESVSYWTGGWLRRVR